MGETLWISTQHPIESTKNFANAAYEISETVVDYCKDLDRDKIEGCIEQIKILYDHYDQLNDTQKGELIGYAIGKYGVEIFATGGILKGVTALKNLKNANRICNLEAMVVSNANKEAILSSALKHAAERENYLKNVKIHWDMQNKHIPGKHNFEKGKGIISIEPHKLETLVKEHVGKGQKVAGEFGKTGFVERVDFKTYIGKYAPGPNIDSIQYKPTTKGIIKYSKDGKVHVIPSDPNAIIK
ncbi:MAG: polymorphic toxin type 50 domain-containing protein [Parachlamydiaceae bacterium]|nr:polymorphic toxin type 50 domain-containing protein [Parachlamydiaceae bacterium]